MKKLIGFVQKEFYHILRDKRTLIILLGMPIVQIMLFGFAITTEISNANIIIYDKAKDNTSREIIERLTSSSYFNLAVNAESYDDIHEQFKANKGKIAVIIPADFTRSLEISGIGDIQIIADATEPNTANSLTMYASSIIRGYFSEQAGTQSAEMGIIAEPRMWFNPELKGVYMFIPGLITIILMLISAMMTSIAITREKELGSMEVLLSSPMSPVMVIIAKVIPYLLLSFVNLLIILLLGVFVFGVPIVGNLILLLAISMLFVTMALSLGIFISTKAATQQVALLMSMGGLMLPTILLSGYIFPIENMPQWLQVISYAIPPRWFVIIVKEIMLKGADFSGVWKETLYIAGFTVLFLLLSIKNFKVRL
jgi:ABC-2 type transport system permease protein